MAYLYLLIPMVLLAVTSCSDTEKSDDGNARSAILEVGGSKIFLDEVRATPPTEEEIKSQVLTEFHRQLTYLVQQKVWEKAQKQWGISFTDQDVIADSQSFFDKTKIDRERFEKDLARSDALIESMKMYLAGTDAKEAYQRYSDKLQFPYEVWIQLLRNKVQAERDVERFEEQSKAERELLLKSDKDLIEAGKYSFLKFLKPAYRSRRVAMAICDSKGISAEKVEGKKKVIDKPCLDYAADWMSKYSQDQVKVLNPVAAVYEFPISYYRDITAFDRWMESGMR